MSEPEIKLHEINPRENVGRDTIARYQAQFRAAGYACISILENKEIDRVYCDYHDDFVVRKKIDGRVYYHFFQVKTKKKKNFQWGLLDIFGIYKRKLQDVSKIKNSFVGKLLVHTTKFKDSCENIVLITNVYFDDDVENIVSDINNGEFTDKNTITLIEKFNECFADEEKIYSDEEIKKIAKKIILKPGVQYLHDDDDSFATVAREEIYKYSEIDLRHEEAEEIINNLISLVEKKSFKILSDINETELDEKAGVGIFDLLEILSISKRAYSQLVKGGDNKALKNASIIQRVLKEAKAPEEMIEYSSKVKTDWDCWYRKNRHSVPEFNLNFLHRELNEISRKLVEKEIRFKQIKEEIVQLTSSIEQEGKISGLTHDLLFGGVFSSLVRSEC